MKLFHERENGPVSIKQGLVCTHRRSGGSGVHTKSVKFVIGKNVNTNQYK